MVSSQDSVYLASRKSGGLGVECPGDIYLYIYILYIIYIYVHLYICLYRCVNNPGYRGGGMGSRQLRTCAVACVVFDSVLCSIRTPTINPRCYAGFGSRILLKVTQPKSQMDLPLAILVSNVKVSATTLQVRTVAKGHAASLCCNGSPSHSHTVVGATGEQNFAVDFTPNGGSSTRVHHQR